MPELRMALLAASLAAGIISASLMSIYIVAFLALAAFAAVFIWHRKFPNSLSYVIAFFLIGALRYSQDIHISELDLSNFVHNTTAVEGTVISDPEARSENIRFVLTVDKISLKSKWRKAEGLVLITIYNNERFSDKKLEYGTRVVIFTKPYIPSEPTNPGQFSWKQYLARKGIYSCASVYKPSSIKEIHHNEGNIFLDIAYQTRHILQSSIYHLFGPCEAPVVTGMVLGTYAYLPKQTFTDFTRTGTLHLLAASGFNCAVLMGFSNLVMKRTRILPKWRNLAAIFLIWSYLMIVGFKPSLVRASIMAILWLLATPLGRVANLRNLFFTAAFITLLINPMDLFDIGFQLSYISVWALLSAAPIINQILSNSIIKDNNGQNNGKWYTKLLKVFSNEVQVAIVGTITISLFTAPIIAAYFNYISLVSVPVNVVFAFGVSIIFCIGLLSPLIALIPFLGNAIGALGSGIARLMLDIAHAFGSLQFASVSIASPGLFNLAIYYIFLFILLRFLVKQNANKQA